MILEYIMIMTLLFKKDVKEIVLKINKETYSNNSLLVNIKDNGEKQNVFFFILDVTAS